jgi:GTP-binding protein
MSNLEHPEGKYKSIRDITNDDIKIDDISAEELDYGKKLFCGRCDFVMGVADIEQLPEQEFPEIAFAGRSNVGKSSLLNALTTRKDLARTSNTPGRTQQMNYFNLDERMFLVDLPGYGYAKAPMDVVQKWTEMIYAYLQGRQSLRRVCVLIDSRHGIKKSDEEIMTMLDNAAVNYQIVLTKSDKVKDGKIKRLISEISEVMPKHPAAHPRIVATSSAKGKGIEELRAILGRIIKEYE